MIIQGIDSQSLAGTADGGISRTDTFTGFINVIGSSSSDSIIGIVLSNSIHRWGR